MSEEEKVPPESFAAIMAKPLTCEDRAYIHKMVDELPMFAPDEVLGLFFRRLLAEADAAARLRAALKRYADVDDDVVNDLYMTYARWVLDGGDPAVDAATLKAWKKR